MEESGEVVEDLQMRLRSEWQKKYKEDKHIKADGKVAKPQPTVCFFLCLMYSCCDGLPCCALQSTG